MKKELQRVKRLEDLGKILNMKRPAEVVYDLDQRQERIELLVTYIDKESRVSERITSSPRISLTVVGGRTLMDITDSDICAERYKYEKLTSKKATYEPPANPPYELGSLEIDLGENKTLGISPYYRTAR